MRGWGSKKWPRERPKGVVGMPSVTAVINGSSSKMLAGVWQPKGGYLKPGSFKLEAIDDKGIVDSEENVSPGIVGLAVDYLSRVAKGATPREAFIVAYRGARLLDTRNRNNHHEKVALDLLDKVTGLDDASITAACKLSNYDSVMRAAAGIEFPFKDIDEIEPDTHTADNIRRMVGRCAAFDERFGSPTKQCMTFNGGYTDTMTNGDGDFMTADTLWDMKTNKTRPTPRHTLQIACYLLLGLHSDDKKDYEGVGQIGIFNPRRDEVYTLPLRSIGDEALHQIELNVIGYKESETIFKGSKPTDPVFSFRKPTKEDLDKLAKIMQGYSVYLANMASGDMPRFVYAPDAAYAQVNWAARLRGAGLVAIAGELEGASAAMRGAQDDEDGRAVDMDAAATLLQASDELAGAR